jgi:hypothetical protein
MKQEEITFEQLEAALSEAMQMFNFAVNESSAVKDQAERKLFYKAIGSCLTAIMARVVFSLYRDHEESLKELHKQAMGAISFLKKKRIADKVFNAQEKSDVIH